MNQRCVVGVDLGGTNVRAAAYLEDGTLVSQKFSNPSRAQEGSQAIFDAIAKTTQQAIGSSTVVPEGIGLAIPGHIDDLHGIVKWAPNFGEFNNGVFINWENVPMREPLSRLIAQPIFMGNDANAAALGEYKFGVGRNSAKCLVMLTIGTGIGGGVVMMPDAVFGHAQGPLLLLGGNKGGAEIGHMIIQHGGLDCNAGSYGAIEGYCQRDAIVSRAVHRLKRGRSSVIDDLTEGDLSKVTPRILSEAAEKGDELARQVWEEIGTYLGIGIANCINIFAPDIVAVGGQIAKAGEFLLGPARRAARDAAIPSLFSDAEIVQAEQLEDAGMIGGAAMALEALKWK